MYLCGKKMEHIRTDFGLLERARTCWDAASGFRADRDRNKRFTYGDQWSDLVDDGVSKVPEETLIRRQGNTPLKNNLIRRLVRNVLGVYRNRWTLPECVARDPAESVRTATMQRLMHFNIATNRMEELYSRSMEEFLIGGLVVHKKMVRKQREPHRLAGQTSCSRTDSSSTLHPRFQRMGHNPCRRDPRHEFR